MGNKNGCLIECLVVGGLMGFISFAIVSGRIHRNQDLGESRGYVVPQRFSMRELDLDLDGKKETVANYHGKNYLFRLGTNGIPYLQPIRGLENEVEKK